MPGEHEMGREYDPSSGQYGGALPQPGAPAGPPTGTPATPATAATPSVDPFTQLINMILRSQLQGDLSKYFNPQTAMPGAGSMFTPGLTTPPGSSVGVPAGQTGTMPPTNPPMLPGGGYGAPAPSGGFTAGLPDPTAAAGYAFQPPSQSPLPNPTTSMQGPAGTNQGWLQFLGNLGIQGLPQPSMAGGGSLMTGA